MKRQVLIIIQLLLLAPEAWCRRQTYSLPNLVAKADFILIGTVTKIDLFEPDGRRLTKEYYSANGPGRNNTIRFLIKVDQAHPLKSKTKDLPKNLVISTIWKYFSTVPQMQAFQGQTMIFLLGDKFEPVAPYNFLQPMREKATIEQFLKHGKPHRERDL